MALSSSLNQAVSKAGAAKAKNSNHFAKASAAFSGPLRTLRREIPDAKRSGT
jgi:hypothetical protein